MYCQVATVAMRFTLPPEHQTIGCAADNVSAILSEQGTHANPPLLLDWSYLKAEDGTQGPIDQGDGNYLAEVEVLVPFPIANEAKLMNHLNRCGVRALVTKAWAPAELADDYQEGEFWN